MGVKETKETLRAQVTEVCHGYCLQVWKEALNLAKADGAFELRNPKKVFYPLALREVTPSTTEVASTTPAAPQPTEKIATVVSLPADKSTVSAS